jgi:hypothetical protein
MSEEAAKPDPSWTDARGCLTAAGRAAVRAAPPGAAPVELAAHLASCKPCQYRLLSDGRPPPNPGERRQAPLVWRVAVLGVAGVLLALLALISVRWLAG